MEEKYCSVAGSTSGEIDWEGLKHWESPGSYIYPIDWVATDITSKVKFEATKIIKPTEMFLGKVQSVGKVKLPFSVDHLRDDYSGEYSDKRFHVSKKYRIDGVTKNDILAIMYRKSSDSRLIVTKVEIPDGVELTVDFEEISYRNFINCIKKISSMRLTEKNEFINHISELHESVLGSEFEKIHLSLSPDIAFELWEILHSSPECDTAYNFTHYVLKPDEKEKGMPINLSDPEEKTSENEHVEIWVGDKWIPENVIPLLVALESQMTTGEPINILATGESGYGKTTLFETIAKKLDMDFLRVNCATVIDTESWFGYQEARGGDTVFLPTDFTKAVVGGNCLIVLDEANRIEPWIANSLFPILDYARETTVHGEHIVVGPNVIFGLTMNIGSQFSGTFTYDEAMKNRIDAFIEVSEPPFGIEKEIVSKRYPEVDTLDIQKILLVLTELRSSKVTISANVSTRTALKIARLIHLGMSVRDAMYFSLINSSEEIDRKEIVDIVNMKIGID